MKIADRCRCATCLAFQRNYDYHWPTAYGKDGFATEFWRNPKGVCGICNDDRGHEHITFIPAVLSEFFGTKKICETCRNIIQSYVWEWGLCWGSSPDWALKWALADKVFNGYQYHFSSANGIDRSFHAKLCCEANHGRLVRARTQTS